MITEKKNIVMHLFVIKSKQSTKNKIIIHNVDY